MGKSEKEQRKNISIAVRAQSGISICLTMACLSPVHGFHNFFISPPVIKAIVHEACKR